MPHQLKMILPGVLALAGAIHAGTFVHPVETPAVPSVLAARSALLATERAGPRVVAVGWRGHIVYSDDEGGTWRQAVVPVSVDLLAVSFPSPKVGWAVGHGGVVLVTRDGGATWTKQLAGAQAAEIAVRYYRGRSAPTPDEERALVQAEAQLARGVAQPFLDVRFENETSGFVVGAFNTIFRTEDAGRTWVPWMDRTSNPDELHFNAVRGRAGRVFLAGEQGKVWRLEPGARTFAPVPAPYAGTFFGLVTAETGTVLAFGMRGVVYRSPDQGASWHPVKVDSGAGITAGTGLPDGRIALVDQGGGIHFSQDDGRTFVTTRLNPPMPCHGVAAGGKGNLILAGAAGAFRLPLP